MFCMAIFAAIASVFLPFLCNFLSFFLVLLIHLLTGRNWAGLVEEVMTVDMDRKALGSVLDEMAGQWPLDLARELAALAMRCMSIKAKPNSELSIARVLEELNEIRRNGDEIVEREGPKTIIGGCIDREGSSDMPSAFLCPILQVSLLIF